MRAAGVADKKERPKVTNDFRGAVCLFPQFVCSRGLFVPAVCLFFLRPRGYARDHGVRICRRAASRRLPCAAFLVTAFVVCRGALRRTCSAPRLRRMRPCARSGSGRGVRRFCRRCFPLRRAVWLPLPLSFSCGSPCSPRLRCRPDPTSFRRRRVCTAAYRP